MRAIKFTSWQDDGLYIGFLGDSCKVSMRRSNIHKEEGEWAWAAVVLTIEPNISK